MAKMKDQVGKFVTGSKASKTPKPKSLTPKTNSTKAGDNKRNGPYSRPVTGK